MKLLAISISLLLMASPSMAALVDTGLVVRYYFDEAGSGTTPTEAIDTSGVGTAFNLNINYGSSGANYVEEDEGRGWDSLNTTGTQRLSKIVGTDDKVDDAMTGAQNATWEFVTEIDAGTTNGPRVISLADGSGNGTFTVVCGFPISPAESGQIRFNDALNESFNFRLGFKDVYHIVLDTTQADQANRLKVYRNGAEITSTLAVAITQNTAMNDVTGDYISAMNRENGDRATNGRIYYAALYNHAFTSAEVTQNYDILVLDDDTPARRIMVIE